MYLVKIGNFRIKTNKNPFVHSYKSGVFTFFNFVVFFQLPVSFPVRWSKIKG